VGKKLIGITGMPGAGKTLAAGYAKQMGYPIIVMGDVVRALTLKMGLKPTPENVGKVMLKIRKDHGPAAVAERCIFLIKKMPSNVVIIEGIRSLDEVKAFKKSFPNFTLVALHASQQTRFDRLNRRNRSDDSRLWDVFAERDSRELSVGLGSAIAYADYMIVNEGTIGELHRNIKRILERIVSK
jgi:dephospho-CoA kinase